MIITVREVDVESDVFLDMPKEVQLLYFHLKERGLVINNPKAMMRMCNCREGDLEMLCDKGFVEKPLDIKKALSLED